MDIQGQGWCFACVGCAGCKGVSFELYLIVQGNLLTTSYRQKDFWHSEPPLNNSSAGSISAPDDADKSRGAPQPMTRAIDETKAGEKLA